jgi:signal transduction histidine kinase
MVSHEMGTPLHTISTNIDVFVKRFGWNFTQDQRGLLDTARATAIGMQTLVDDLDLLSRRDAGELQMNPEPTDLGVEVYKAAIEMNLVAQEEGVTLQTYAEQHLPPALVDTMRARQVARNLIINAIKFTPRGGRVRVSVHAKGDWVTLQVEDTGVGIPEHLRGLIWNRYYRVPQPEGTDRIAGRGLGLAIVRIIVEAHHGRRDVQHAAGNKGTVFTVSFPRVGAAAQR